METSKFIALTGTFVETDMGFSTFRSVEDAKLFADALTTIQKCDLMPSELKAQRDELLELANDIMDVYNKKGQLLSFDVNKVRELINKCK